MNARQTREEERHGLFEARLAAHSGIVFRVVRTYCRHPEDQKDLAQEIRLQLWWAFANYDERRSFSTWMYRIALNVAISWTRYQRARVQPSVPLKEVADRAAEPTATEGLEDLFAVLDRLDPFNRALMLLYLDDLSHAEIGEILGITAINVATKLSRLRQRLRAESANELKEN